VVSQDKSAREALQTFTAGTGDVLISYENEAITAIDKKQPVEYVIPDQTLLIENPIAVTSTSKNAEKAKALVGYLRSEPAQKIYAEHGYRPVLESAIDPEQFPTPKDLFTISTLGGWPAVDAKFFTPDGVVGQIEKSLGVATG
jgi:sulfate transport system substrate-binding protein